MPYNELFLAKKVTLPKLSKEQKSDSVPIQGSKNFIIPHDAYSVALSASRRLAWFSCSNIDAQLKQHILRKNLTSRWRIEEMLPPTAVISDGWYKPSQKLLHRGHLTPADIMEWGADDKLATANANSTFYFSNAAPQLRDLNSIEWQFLEAYISGEALKAGQSRISVQTGPVLANDDPDYIHQIEQGFNLKIPRLFWKVVYYINPANKLCRIGFMMSQNQLLKQSGLLMPTVPLFESTKKDAEGPFADLEDQKTYQVNVQMIEGLTGLKLQKATEPFQNDRPQELTLMEVDLPPRIHPELESTSKLALKPQKILLGLQM